MKIQVLGPGCTNCKNLERAVEAALKQLGLEIPVEKVVDPVEIARLGVMRTPGLVIDGRVVVSGRVPTAGEVAKLLAP